MKLIIFFSFTILLYTNCSETLGPMSSEKLKKEIPTFDSCQMTDYDTLMQKNYIVGGCGNIVVYGFTDSVHLLVVKIDTALLHLSEKCTIVDLSFENPGIDILGYFYRDKVKKNNNIISLPICSDIKTDSYGKDIVLLNQISRGTLYATKSSNKDIEGRYNCTVKVENILLFDSQRSQAYSIRKFVFYNVLVGWKAG